jgi:hypothetical protein
MTEKPSSDITTLSESLSNFLSGTMTVSVNNFPFLKIDGESRTFDIEIKGLKESGIETSSLLGESRHGMLETLKRSERIGEGLHEKGWRLRVFEGGRSVLSMGRGAPSLTGFVWGNPLGLLKILGAI